MNISKTIKEFEKLSRQELIDIMREERDIVLAAFDVITDYDEAKTLSWFLILVGSACAADGAFDEHEHKFFVDAMQINISYPDMLAIVKNSVGNSSAENVNTIVDAFGRAEPAIKESMVRLMLCFLCANGNVEFAERAFIKKILE